MNEPSWALSPHADADGALLDAALLESYRRLYALQFAGDPWANHALPVELRAERDLGVWRVALLLTPWLLARVWLPRQPPEGLALPPGWSARERAEEPYTVLGPLLAFSVAGTEQRAHLNFLPDLGHHLVQPLILNLEPYADGDAAFAAWRAVIDRRDRIMAETRRDCAWQKEVSRREFFAGLGKRRDPGEG